jgi:hypothetical protein
MDRSNMDMLSVLEMPGPLGPVPDGLKVITLSGPDTLQPAPLNLALGVGGFTLWPMSYMDNRVSFGMVMYDLNWEVVTTVEKPGARYVYNIELSSDAGSQGIVIFWGQASQKVVMTLDEICDMMCA